MNSIQLDYLQSSIFRQYVGMYIDKLGTCDLHSYEMLIESDNTSTLLPGTGEFHYEHDDETFVIKHTEEGVPVGDPPRYYRRLTIQHPNRALLQAFVATALTYKPAVPAHTIKVHSSTGKGYWDYRDTMCAQDLKHIFIPQQVKDTIIKHIDIFNNSKQRYVDFGKQHKLGFLLTGVPGSGKTSLVKAIALKYSRPVYILNFTKSMTDERLIELINDIKDESILLIEDIDACFFERKAQDINVSFSALINVLDGVLAKGDGLIVFMTANNPDRLDPALIRPGRVDKIIKFDYPRKKEICDAFECLVSAPTSDELDRFYNSIKDVKVSMSAVMDYLFRHPDDYLDNTSELIEQSKLYHEIVNDNTDKLYN